MSKKKENRSRIIGISKDGKIKTITGIFQLYDTYGLPFGVSFMECKKKDLMPDWIDLYIQATKKAGWKYERLRTRLSLPIQDAWGRETRDKILEKLDWLDKNQEYLDRYQELLSTVKLKITTD